MNQRNDILDIASELADITAFKGGPTGILSRLTEKFKLRVHPDAQIRQLNEALSEHTYRLTRSSKELNISFLFHALSGRWYVNAIK